MTDDEPTPRPLVYAVAFVVVWGLGLAVVSAVLHVAARP